MKWFKTIIDFYCEVKSTSLDEALYLLEEDKDDTTTYDVNYNRLPSSD
jgi:hypothetical protein